MYTYIGCYRDRPTRLFPVKPFTTSNNEMSPNICFNHCNSKNYEYFATELGSQCFCGHSGKLGSDQYPRKNKRNCNMTCQGHGPIKCGGTWRASVYKINSFGQHLSTTNLTPSPKKSQSDIGIDIGITIVTVVLLSIVTVVSFLFWKRRKQKVHIKESSMSDHEYDRNQNITTSDSSSIELNVYENGHTYGNTNNSHNTTRISNGNIKPQTCNTSARHKHNKPDTEPGHVNNNLDKRSILKNMLPSLLHKYFKLDNDKTDKVNRNHIADVSQTEPDLTAGSSNGVYATIDSTATGFNKGKRVFPGNKQNIDQTKLEKKKHVTKGEGDYCCVEGEYNTLNQIRRFSNNGTFYSHAIDCVYDISGNTNQSKTTDNTYDHFFGGQSVKAADYDNVMKY